MAASRNGQQITDPANHDGPEIHAAEKMKFCQNYKCGRPKIPSNSPYCRNCSGGPQT